MSLNVTYAESQWCERYRKLCIFRPRNRRVWRHARFLCFKLRYTLHLRSTNPWLFGCAIAYDPQGGRLYDIVERVANRKANP